MNRSAFTATPHRLFTGHTPKAYQIWISSDSLTRFGVATIFSMILSVPAFSDETDIEFMRRGLMDYAEAAGLAAACDPDRPDRIDEFASRLAKLRYPSWWSWLNGERDAYEKLTQPIAQLKHSVAVLKGCEPMFGSTYDAIADRWEQMLDEELGQ